MSKRERGGGEEGGREEREQGGEREEREGEERFHCIYFPQNIGGSDEAMVAWQDHKLEGTSQSLEKQYLRLTSVSGQVRQESFLPIVDNTIVILRHLIRVLFAH